jgi:hypothetical protein
MASNLSSLSSTSLSSAAFVAASLSTGAARKEVARGERILNNVSVILSTGRA